jgi:hypothetical protein
MARRNEAFEKLAQVAAKAATPVMNRGIMRGFSKFSNLESTVCDYPAGFCF